MTASSRRPRLPAIMLTGLRRGQSDQGEQAVHRESMRFMHESGLLLIPQGDLHSAARALCYAGQGLPTLKALRAPFTMMFGTCLAMTSTATAITMCPRHLQTLLWSQIGRLQVCLFHTNVHTSHALRPPIADCKHLWQQRISISLSSLAVSCRKVTWPAGWRSVGPYASWEIWAFLSISLLNPAANPACRALRLWTERPEAEAAAAPAVSTTACRCQRAAAAGADGWRAAAQAPAAAAQQACRGRWCPAEQPLWRCQAPGGYLEGQQPASASVWGILSAALPRRNT